jgi:ribosomal protein S4
MELSAMAGRGREAERELKRQQEDERHALAPVGSLMFGEVERRIDVFLFRSCFAHSVYEARRLVIHGDVKLNGVKVHTAFFALSSSSCTLFSVVSFIC